MTTALTQAQIQGLALTPQLQQSLKVLQASQDELLTLIEHELTENPLLEIEEQNEELPLDDQTFEGLIVDARATSSSSAPPLSGNIESTYEGSTQQTLQGYLVEQLSMERISKSIRAICLFIIQNLGEDGYLELKNEEIARITHSSLSEVVEAVTVIHSLEPHGVGARDLRECLLIQLRNSGKASSLEARIIERNSNLLASGRIERIAENELVPVKEVLRAIQEIKQLCPFPGAPYVVDAQQQTIVPDVFVRSANGQVRVTLNDRASPRVFVNSSYGDIVTNGHDRVAARYIRKRVQSAQWFLHCIEQRHQTLHAVAQCIVDLEKEFFTDGIDSFRPLYLKDIASRIKMHESTVSRAIANKYMDTPRGVFEFKYFFTSRIETSQGEVSSLLVKEVIKSLVQREDKKKPMSDYKIADALKDTKISIARRTVTKYREELGIPSASLRKLHAFAQA